MYACVNIQICTLICNILEIGIKFSKLAPSDQIFGSNYWQLSVKLISFDKTWYRCFLANSLHITQVFISILMAQPDLATHRLKLASKNLESSLLYNTNLMDLQSCSNPVQDFFDLNFPVWNQRQITASYSVYIW